MCKRLISLTIIYIQSSSHSLFVIIFIDVQLGDALGRLQDVDVLDRLLLLGPPAEDDEVVVGENSGGVVGARAGDATVYDWLEPY